MMELYTIPIGFVKYLFPFFSENFRRNLAEHAVRMLYWKQMQAKQHPKGGMRMGQADDERQFLAACYQRHRIAMIRAAQWYAADSAAVEDIVSDSLVALMEKIDLLRALTEEQERTYVLAVVRNTRGTNCAGSSGIAGDSCATAMRRSRIIPTRRRWKRRC